MNLRAETVQVGRNIIDMTFELKTLCITMRKPTDFGLDVWVTSHTFV